MKCRHLVRSTLTAAASSFPVAALAHPGHGALEGHIHAAGTESLMVLGVVLVLLIVALFRR